MKSLTTISVLALASLGFAARCPAGDEYSFFFTVSNDVTPDQPSTTVTLWSAFPKNLYAFEHSHTEVLSVPDSGGFSDPTVLIFQWFYSYPGDVSQDGDSVSNIFLRQYHFLHGQVADPSNPLELWSVTWSTDDFTPRKVPIVTQTSDFWVYTNDGGHGENFYGPDFAEAEGVIRVVPAPGATLFVGAGLWIARRRR